AMTSISPTSETDPPTSAHQGPLQSDDGLAYSFRSKGGFDVSRSRHHVLQARSGTSHGPEVSRSGKAGTEHGLRLDACDDGRQRRTLLDGCDRDGGREPGEIRRNDTKIDGAEGVPGGDERVSRSRR